MRLGDGLGGGAGDAAAQRRRTSSPATAAAGARVGIGGSTRVGSPSRSSRAWMPASNSDRAGQGVAEAARERLGRSARAPAAGRPATVAGLAALPVERPGSAVGRAGERAAAGGRRDGARRCSSTSRWLGQDHVGGDALVLAGPQAHGDAVAGGQAGRHEAAERSAEGQAGHRRVAEHLVELVELLGAHADAAVGDHELVAAAGAGAVDPHAWCRAARTGWRSRAARPRGGRRR